MSYSEYLKQLLRPLGVYRLDGSLGGGELEGIGAVLDACWETFEHTGREMNLTTAEDDGLDALESLLTRVPVASSVQRRREALAALLRIGGDSFTVSAINDNLSGCGLNAVVQEMEPRQTVGITFPDVPGIPDGFEQIKKVIEDILPCHLAVEYLFWYITWAMLEARFASWNEMEAATPTWEGLEKLVREP